jgi:hypothetical protein
MNALDGYVEVASNSTRAPVRQLFLDRVARHDVAHPFSTGHVERFRRKTKEAKVPDLPHMLVGRPSIVAMLRVNEAAF